MPAPSGVLGPVALATLGPSAFAALVWGSLALVGLVLAWQVWVLVREWRRGRDAEPSAGSG
jgi:hypothetical protein